MRIKTIIITLLIINVNLTAKSGQKLPINTVHIKTIESSFIQKKYLKLLKKPLVSKGKFLYHTDGLFRWEYISPRKSILLKKGNTISRYVDHGQGYVKESSQGMKPMGIIIDKISKWIHGNYDNNEFETKSALTNGKRHITLIPKNHSLKMYIQNIQIKMLNAKGVISSITINEANGNYTRIAFYNVRINKRIPKARFTKM